MDKILSGSLSLLSILVGLFSYFFSQISNHSSIEKTYFISVTVTIGLLIITVGTCGIVSAYKSLQAESIQPKLLKHIFIGVIITLTLFPILVWQIFPLIYNFTS